MAAFVSHVVVIARGKRRWSPRLAAATALLTVGLAAAALISLPHGGGPGAPSLAEEAGFVSAAQAALWKMERKHGVHDTEAWTAAANASIALLEAHMAAAPGGILAVQAERTSRVYYQKEETKGIHDPDAVHVDNVLDSNARKSARAHARWAATKKGVEEEDDYKDQDLGRLLGSAHADERGAVQATRVLAAPVGSADAPESAREKAYHARELEEKAKEAKILAKAESARKEAHDIAEERKVKPAAAISSHEDAANHKTASGTPGGTVPSAAAAAPTSPSDGNVTIVKGEADSESTKGAATGKVAPGMLCLKDGGLNDQELNDFTSSTVCVGWEIKRNIGLGDTVHMMKDFLEAPMNKKKIAHCVEKINTESRKVIKACLNQLPEKQRAGNPVVEFWDTIV